MARDSLKSVARLLQSTQEGAVSVEQSFLADLKRSIELQDEAESRPPSQSYKPSSMQCIRNMYYQMTGAEQTESKASYALIGICNSGTDIHARIQKAVLGMGSCNLDCEYVSVEEFVKSRGLTDLKIVKKSNFAKGNFETKLYHKKLRISFLCDGIIKYKGQYFILELKTESGNKFMARKGVDPKHYDQGTCYSLMFGLDRVIFVYISRDVLDMKAYMLEVTDEMRKSVVDRIEECDTYVAKNEVPPKPELPRGVCTYCAYFNRCQDEKGERNGES